MKRPSKAPPLDPTVPCDVFPGAITSAGYGNRKRDGRYITAHKAAWEDTVGPVPVGYELHHTCEVKACREVRHLELLTHAEHAARHAAKRTHCRNGHRRTKANRYTHNGVDRCRDCRRDVITKRRAA